MRNVTDGILKARSRLPVSSIAGIVLLAAFLGGGTAEWSRALVFVCIGVLVAMKPPQASGGCGVLYCAVGMLILGLCPFLPAHFFGAQPWRDALSAADLPLAATLTPQPWMTLDAWFGLLAGVTWMLWLGLQSWSREERRAAARTFAAGAGILALVALGVSLARVKIPFWISEWGFGPFPNRNQTGNFFALGAILAVACAREDWVEKRKRAPLWLPLVAALVAGVAFSFSRGAMLVLAGGISAWLLAGVCFSRSVKSAALAGSAVFALMTLLLLAGGETVRRFQGGADPWGALGFRALIHRDCLALIHAAPWCGIGLGNFDAVFPAFRAASAIPQRVLHPESDWLWLAAEMGWPSVALVLCAAGLLAARVFPLEKGTVRHLRAAAAIAALGFALHGLVDVAGHRFGTALAGMFVFGLALQRPSPGVANRFFPWLFRLSGALLIAAGLCRLSVSWSGASPPTAGGVANLKARAGHSAGEQHFDDAIDAATRALQWAPLDWELYYWRGLAGVCGNRPLAAVQDFQRANFLEPQSRDLPFEEGRLWLGVRPEFALAPWGETLRRCPRGDAELYARMLGMAGDSEPLLWPLYEMGADDPARLLAFLRHATGGPFDAALKNLLRADPALATLDAAQRKSFFQVWSEKGDARALAQLLAAHPEWR